ncbi:MAG: UDP-N-acetylglucosamine 1-carboxyvinyltransferase MurA [Parcubacteria group bacterium GW2011_GWD2_38_12]|nr:MAG: UDP-N-acetylglucosamine 1-carboxyvinyltransferase MurA [Parcubacteria group bacterium GW2011_GWC2_36_17]KKQ43898.1 MAG: UDP-N-acetylglucosamine 1-carboxyvinyltransferase MurA [Parcubacteria group bacterium GW2011_GWE2_37_8]KKQ52827.1 MAG: UDP-N-acetylglucosamine 1-carboxyvinyltransferase MurA [Parcubacteria group bacterium GW2011_GWD2_38_12]KKQ59031.1 MAG: UDP-N-acetylglucosamine 1-carboxyvinyltransferase MurA [Parcubacteria group bacterium GW2011_GWC1_38_17]KKQ59646.1 MAG: UDP-N-acetyl
MEHSGKFLIKGGRKLSGEIDIMGSKNAATPILAATLLTSEECIIDNIPLIEDVFRLIEILKHLGAEADFIGKRKLKIRARNIDVGRLNNAGVGKLRSSVLLMGPLLARFRKIQTKNPGGCLIGNRPLDTHLEAFVDLGAKIAPNGNNLDIILKNKPKDEIVLKEFSVTATENVLMFASLMPQRTIIKIAAMEPHVRDLIKFLRAMGVKIKLLDSHTIEVVGVKKLRGAKHKIIPDQIEAGTFLIIGALIGSDILVKNCRIDHLDLILKKLKEFNIDYKFEKRRGNFADIRIKTNYPLRAAKVQAMPYPGIPTDLQSIFGVLATQAQGTSMIHDPLFEGRFKYLDELVKMGANVVVCDPHRALITGRTQLQGTNITSYDLRAGASLIIAGLIASGETVINDAYQVDRGYERIEERLQKLGADITRI